MTLAGRARRRPAPRASDRRRHRGAGRAVPEVGRLVWSEADGLPGLVVDRYGPVLVVQCQTLGIRRMRDDLVAALRARLGDLAVLGSDDPVVARPGGVRAGVRLDRAGRAGRGDPLRGRRADRRATGQRPQDRRSTWTRPPTACAWGRRPAPATSWTSSPTPPASPVHALRGGARRAVCVESSPEAIAGARRNLELNGSGRARRDPRRQRLRRAPPPRPRARPLRPDRPGPAAVRPQPHRARRRPARLQGDQPARPAAARRPAGAWRPSPAPTTWTSRPSRRPCGRRPPTPVSAYASWTTSPSRADHPVLLTVPETRYLKGCSSRA